MRDPTIEAHLWFLLGERSFVTLEQVCWWDSARAEAAVMAASLTRISNSAAFSTTEDTATWFEETWNEIRAQRPAPAHREDPNTVATPPAFRVISRYIASGRVG